MEQTGCLFVGSDHFRGFVPMDDGGTAILIDDAYATDNEAKAHALPKFSVNCRGKCLLVGMCGATLEANGGQAFIASNMGTDELQFLQASK